MIATLPLIPHIEKQRHASHPPVNSKQTWHGQGLFFESQTSRALDANVMISPDGITVQHNATQTYFPWNRLKMTVAGNGYVRIEIRGSGGSVLSLQSFEALGTLAANHQLRRGLLGRLSHTQKLLVSTLAFMVVVVFFFTVGLDFLVEVGVKLVPSELENNLGSAIFSGIIERSKIADDSTTVRVLEKCSDIVKKFDASESPTAYKIVLIENKEIKNAFALPGGYIVLYRGIFDIMDDETELFGLLGHEVGHVVARHGVKRIARSALLAFITSVVLGDARGLSGVLLGNGQVLVNLSYDRKEELEADEFGLKAVQESGINPYGMVMLFEKLKAVDGSAGWVSFLSTHPDIDERLARMKTQLNSRKNIHGPKRLSQAEWKILKSKDH